MTEIELKKAVYRKVIELAVSLIKNNQTMTTSELTKWLNDHFPEFEHPYGDCHGVPLADILSGQQIESINICEGTVKFK